MVKHFQDGLVNRLYRSELSLLAAVVAIAYALLSIRQYIGG